MRRVSMLLALAAAVAADVVVTRLEEDGAVRGISLAADSKRLSVQTADGKVVEVPVEQVIEAVSVPALPPPPEAKRPFEVRLLDGSVVRGTLAEAKPDHLRIVCPGLGAGARALDISIEEILAVRRISGARMPGASRLVRVQDQDSAYRLDGSRVTGTVESFEAEGVRLDRGELGTRVVPYADLAALFVDNSAGDPPSGLLAVARLHDGSSFILPAGFRIARGELVGKTPSGVAVRAPAGHLVSLGFRGGQFEHLSDRKPIKVDRTPFFPLPKGPAREVMLDFVCPVRLDRSPDGRGISLQGRRHYKGIGVRPETALTWKIGKGFRRFTALCGVDDEVLGPEYGRGAGSGSVVFRVELDGKEVWNSGVVEGGKPPKPVALELGNARTLTLRVTVVPAGQMPKGRTDSTELDNAVWARPLLIR
ncbi:MAG: NPCBM/NEW2 domain-containing protein [Planctomycetota bacterium]|jgi:hypothetical protein